MRKYLALLVWCAVSLAVGSVAITIADEPAARPSLWVDLYRGEPVAYEEILDDLAEVRVVYLGETHPLDRHHAWQTQVIGDLAERDVPMVVGLEQLEADQQPAVDRFNRGEIDFDGLVEAIDWAQRWDNYAQYRPLIEAAKRAGAPLLALNARQEVIRQVARGGGVDQLDPAMRKELPKEIFLDDPDYERFLNIQMMVHVAATPDYLRPMFEAQMARDEMMASVLAEYLASPEGKGRTAIVICGAGHMTYGLGTPTRVRRRLPDVTERIVLFSDSGDLELTPAELAAARDIEITHEQLRQIARPIGDYLHVTGLKPE